MSTDSEEIRITPVGRQTGGGGGEEDGAKTARGEESGLSGLARRVTG